MSDGEALLRKADKAASGAGGGFSFFGGKQSKYEEAAQLYLDAANALRTQRNLQEAGRAFEKAAGIQKSNLNEALDAANSLTEAFKSYRKTSPLDAARCMEGAINIYTANGNFRRAATNMQTLGELYELEVDDKAKALQCFETAANWYSDDNAEALANKLLLKVGDLSAEQNDFYKAISQFEKVARASVDSNLMRWSVKDYLFKAILCHLATNDIVGSTRALEEYEQLDNSFSQTRECMLCRDLLQAVEQQDVDMFSEKLYHFDQMSKLDKWKTAILLKIKNGIEAAGDDFS